MEMRIDYMAYSRGKEGYDVVIDLLQEDVSNVNIPFLTGVDSFDIVQTDEGFRVSFEILDREDLEDLDVFEYLNVIKRAILGIWDVSQLRKV